MVLTKGSWSAAAERAGGAGLRESARARYVLARALDLSAEAQRDNRLLSRAIGAYLDLLKMNERLSDKKLIEIAARAVDRIQFRGELVLIVHFSQFILVYRRVCVPAIARYNSRRPWQTRS